MSKQMELYGQQTNSKWKKKTNILQEKQWNTTNNITKITYIKQQKLKNLSTKTPDNIPQSEKLQTINNASGSDRLYENISKLSHPQWLKTIYEPYQVF